MGNYVGGNIGKHTNIQVIKRDDRSDDEDGYVHTWSVIYNIYDTTCTVVFEKYIDHDHRVRDVFFRLNDSICSGDGMRMRISRSSTNVQNKSMNFHYKCDQRFNDLMSYNFKETFKTGGVVMTWVFRYGRGDRGSLIVVSGKRKRRDDKNIYAITVAQYNAISRGYDLIDNKIDIGLSFVVYFEVLHASLDYRVVGPVRHPSSSLFHMFENVYESGSWEPESCSHCRRIPEESTYSNFYGTTPKYMAWLNPLSPQLASQPILAASNPDRSQNTLPIISQSIDNKDINGNGNGNHIEGDQRVTTSAPNVPNYGPKENKRFELIDNNGVNGNGNGNRIEGDQKFSFKFALSVLLKLLLPDN